MAFPSELASLGPRYFFFRGALHTTVSICFFSPLPMSMVTVSPTANRYGGIHS